MQSEQREEYPWALIGLPSFPPLALQVLQLASNTGTQLKQLRDLITTDQAFSSEVLTIANSPLFASRAEVNSVLQAIALLGLDRVKGLALTVGIRRYLADSLTTPMLRDCWRHSLACALITEELAAASLMEAQTAYTAGMIHDIGRLGLIATQAKRYASYLEALKQQGQRPADLLRHEREVFGTDHCMVGKALTEAWKLPQVLIDVASFHHAGGNGKMDVQHAVAQSCKMATAVGFSALPTSSPSLSDTLAILPKELQDHFLKHQEQFSFRVADKVNAVECALGL